MEKKRQKLLIKETYGVKSIGDKGLKKLNFLVGDQRWGTFSEALFPYIKAGTEIDADTEVKETQGKDGTTYINRVVTQIYVDGKPIKGRGGFLRGKSPEEIVSIETQVAVKEINAAWIAGKLTDKDAEVVEARKWWLSKVKRANQGAEHVKPSLPQPNEPKSAGLITPEQETQITKLSKQLGKKITFTRPPTKEEAQKMIEKLDLEKATKEFEELGEH